MIPWGWTLRTMWPRGCCPPHLLGQPHTEETAAHHGSDYFMIYFYSSLFLGMQEGPALRSGPAGLLRVSVSPPRHHFPFSACRLSLSVSGLPACSHGGYFCALHLFSWWLQASDLFHLL